MRKKKINVIALIIVVIIIVDMAFFKSELLISVSKIIVDLFMGLGKKLGELLANTIMNN